MPNPITWPEDRMPTPTEWVEWFQGHDEDGQLDIAENLLVRLAVHAGDAIQIQDLLGRLTSVKHEVQRLTNVLSTLGFCPKDGEPMPCTTCGAGL